MTAARIRRVRALVGHAEGGSEAGFDTAHRLGGDRSQVGSDLVVVDRASRTSESGGRTVALLLARGEH